MNLKLNLPQEKVEMLALFFGTVLIASVFSGTAFFLIQHRLPPSSSPLPLWLAGGFCLSAIFLATQIQNTLLRVAILSWGISKIVTWLLSSNDGMTAWLTHNVFFLLTGVLMIIVGIRKCRVRVCMGALFLLIGLSVFQYFATANWARTLENIGHH